jgi:tight adherence protein B
VSRAALFALAAGGAGVFGAWEAIVALERARLPARLGRIVAPLRRTAPAEPSRDERRRLVALGSAVLLAVGWLAAGPALAIAASAAGPAVVAAVVRARTRRHRRAVAAGAATAARVLADAVGSGHAVRGAVGVAAIEVPGAAGEELRRAARELVLGEPTDATLERLRARAHAPAWDTLVAALLLQRDAGGDLAGLLRRLAVSAEAAERAEADARTATAQARFTARLVAGMPIAAAGFAELASPGFTLALLRDPISGWLLAGAAVLQAVGLLSVRRIAR